MKLQFYKIHQTSQAMSDESQSDFEVKAHHSDINDSIAFSLVNDFVKNQEITRYEAEFLRLKYSKMYHQVVDAKSRNGVTQKKCKAIQNEIISEKIMLEKVKIEELEETQQMRRLEKIKIGLQKDLEFTEQKEIMAKFELTELRKMHEELKSDLDSMRSANSNLVEPVLNALKNEIIELSEQLRAGEETLIKENAQKDILSARSIELEKFRNDSQESLRTKIETLKTAEIEPRRILRQVESIKTALNGMENESRGLLRKLKLIDQETEHHNKRKTEAEKLKKNLMEKMELNSQTIEKREQDVAVVRSNLDSAKAKHHDLITKRMELSIKKKDIENSVHHKTDQFNFSKKDYDHMKRQYKKKRLIADSVKQIIPILEEQLNESEINLKAYKDECEKNVKLILKMRDDIDNNLAQFLQQEGFESIKKHELESAIDEVDKLEADVLHWVAEVKRQNKLLSVLSAQRDIKGRDSSRMTQKEKDAKQHVKIKELVILDLTKRCNEISNRLKEFSALYEVVKNERNKYVNLIQSSTQALAEMREKIRILTNEVEILGNESSAKDVALNKEKTAHVQAQHQRDSLRQDMNRLLSEYRSKQSTVEQQIQEIDKLNVVIGSLEKEMLDIKSKYEKAVEERNITGVQLIDRNDELCILYERSNQQQEALKSGERILQSKESELRLIRLQSEELKRRYETARRRLPQVSSHKLAIEELETLLVNERKKTEEFSNKLEDPQNLDRWRPLNGEDPDPEQLAAKIKVLENRLDHKREQLLEKELVLEEVSTLTEKLRLQASSRRESSKYMADELNELQFKIRDTTKKMLASVSELSMYQATALRLQQEKTYRDKLLDEATWRLDHGEVPFDEAAKEYDLIERKKAQEIERLTRREEEVRLQQPTNTSNTTAEPRPTAYIPDDLGIPKPYGNLAPFKPTESGSTMRHIKQPQIKQIEI